MRTTCFACLIFVELIILHFLYKFVSYERPLLLLLLLLLLTTIFLRLYRASCYYQRLLFTNECTSDCLKTVSQFTLK